MGKYKGRGGREGLKGRKGWKEDKRGGAGKRNLDPPIIQTDRRRCREPM
jgi:hypothetical protein